MLTEQNAKMVKICFVFLDNNAKIPLLDFIVPMKLIPDKVLLPSLVQVICLFVVVG